MTFFRATLFSFLDKLFKFSSLYWECYFFTVYFLYLGDSCNIFASRPSSIEREYRDGNNVSVNSNSQVLRCPDWNLFPNLRAYSNF